MAAQLGVVLARTWRPLQIFVETFTLYYFKSLFGFFSGATTFTYFLFKYFRIYKLILSQILVLKCCRSCSAGENLIFLLHCSVVQVHCSTMPFPPWFKPFVSSSIGGTTQFLFEKDDNFVKYTDIEMYHTATFFCTFVTIFAPIFL